MELFLKLLHIAFLSFWLAGALYLPRLFVLHVRSGDEGERARLQALERRVYFGLMTPGGILAVVVGTALIFFGFEGGWLPVKLALVLLLVACHLFCGRTLLALEKHRAPHGPVLLGLLGLAPLPLLFAIVALAVVKPF